MHKLIANPIKYYLESVCLTELNSTPNPICGFVFDKLACLMHNKLSQTVFYQH